MKNKKISLLLVLVLVFVNLNPQFEAGEAKIVSITPQEVFAAPPADPTPTPEPTPTTAPTSTPVPTSTPTPLPGATDLGLQISDASSSFNYTGGMINMNASNSSMRLVITGNDQIMPDIPDSDFEWRTYSTDDLPIIEIEKSAENGRMATVRAVNPGYSSIWVTVKYEGRSYDVMCQVHVTLDLANVAISGNPEIVSDSANWRGMKQGGIFTSGDLASRYTLQLSYNDESVDPFSHYLVKVKNVGYQDGVFWNTLSTEEPLEILQRQPALNWDSSDDTVCTVDEFGIITTHSAGYAEITVTTKTNGSVNGKDVYDEVKFDVIVAPTAKLSTSTDSKQASIRTVVPAKTFTFEVNALNASKLYWEVYKGMDREGEGLDLEDNDFAVVDITERNVVTLSNVKAGIYYLRAVPHEKYRDTPNNISTLNIIVIVPLFVNTKEVLMNVGDTYDIINNSNILDKTFSLRVATGGSNIVNISNGTIAKGISRGSTYVEMTLMQDAVTGLVTIYDDLDLTPEERELIIEYAGLGGFSDFTDIIRIPVKVIDGISLNNTSAIIYVGHTMQLTATSSDESSPIKWASSDDTIASVDENGMITGIKQGDVTITATQIVLIDDDPTDSDPGAAVTKTAVCEVRVVQTVTQIVLDPSTKEMEIGDFLTINATATPASPATSLHWVTSDASIVSVANADRLSATVQAVKGGTAVITAINQNNIVVGSCLITVFEPITSIVLSETNVTMSLLDRWFQLYATVLPEAAENREVIWKSTDTSVAAVDAHGKVTLLKNGKTSIIATAKENASIMAICNLTVTKAVTGIKLDTTTKAMYVGETYRLSYVISPSDASDAAVIWSSTNTGVAAVSSDGLVSAKSVGSTTIIAKTSEGGFMAMCTINVSRNASGIKLDATQLSLNVDDSYLFEAVITPADATETALVWESSDTKVAVISRRGKVTARSSGTAVILVKTKNGATAYCTVKVYEGAEGIEISSEEEYISVGDILELEAEIVPSSASNQGISWKSNKPEVATVNNRGEVEGISGGVAIITATASDGGYIATCIVTVEEMITELIMTPETYRLGVGKSFTLETEIRGEKATNRHVSYESSNTSVATVNENGVVKGLRLGTTTITCYAEDGSGVEAYCDVEVVNLVTGIELNEVYVTIIRGKSFTLQAEITPANATYQTPIYTSSDPAIAVVSEKGIITGLKPGEAIITAAAADSSGVETICYVQVIAPVPATGITPQELEVILSTGETKTVGISISPSNSTDTYTWSSDNNAVASVNEKSGLITANALGSANITVMTESGRKAAIKVIVVGLSRSFVELQQYTDLLLRLEVDGSTSSSNLRVRWDVENQEIATVQNGRVTAKALGTTTVYAVVNGRSLACTVRVVPIK